MSDRVILMNRGRIEQSGTPDDLFWRPRTRFVAQFIGEANVLEGKPEGGEGGRLRIDLGGGVVCLADDAGEVPAGAKSVAIALRGERILLGRRAASCENRFPGRAAEIRFYGSLVELAISLAPELTVRARVTAGEPAARVAIGDPVDVGWEASSVVILAG